MTKFAIKFFLIIFFVLASNLSFAQIVPYNSDLIEADYAKAIDTHRKAEVKSFRNKKTTLLSDEFFPRFTGLNYFPSDLKYRVIGKLTHLPKPKRTNLTMTGGGEYGFVHYGHVSFYIDGKAIKLQAFEYPSRNPKKSIFVPFTDGTTGEESYGGGRFMIINIPKSEQIVLDFNLAINPICVYDPTHACPVPPRSNKLETKIIAGAKMYHDPG